MKTGKENGTPKSNELVQTLRIHEMDDMIRSGRYPNAGDFARHFEVSVRTVSRDLDILRDRYRAPLEFEKEKRLVLHRTQFLHQVHSDFGRRTFRDCAVRAADEAVRKYAD